MDFTIRNEKAEDFNQVENLTREAFWNLYVPGCNEHYLAHIMRDHPDFIKKLDFVAEYNGEIIGNIMYTKAWLYSEDGIKIEIASFGPISVLPKHQRKGVGSALIRHTIDIAKNDGIGVIVIFGDPHNYCKHGFKSSKDFNISDMNGEYPYGMLAVELKEGTVKGHNWKYKYSPVLEINEADAEKYDKKFENKEKEYTPSQEIFSSAVRSYLK